MSRSNFQRELLERELLARPVAGLQYMLGQLAREDGEKRGRMYQVLGLAWGGLLVILLL